ncbi:Tetratricopeptide repeat protein [Planctomycetes bacterium CA13]|uniref:Tetratricopeptide repeat protein n=1 Tax=Novipirellula herctigrandis TaxID=2527986 RepID=A0A5C5Z988_9BACT|nr:Tetratricopeptide repeat protein [Planctomycetes bacterium CA13]
MSKQKPEKNKADSSQKSYDNVALGLLLCAAVAAVGGSGVLFSVWWKTGPPDPIETIDFASREYIQGRVVLAGELARTAKFEDELDADDEDFLPEIEPEEQAEQTAEPDDETAAAPNPEDETAALKKKRDFLIGAGLVARAKESADARSQREHFAEAAPILEKIAASGFPIGREVDGLQFLGEAMFGLGEYDKAAKLLTQAIQRDPTLRRSLTPTLAQAQLKSNEPSADAALATIEEYLRDPALRVPLRRAAENIQIEALTQLRRFEEAQQIIDSKISSLPDPENDPQNELSEYRDQLKLAGAVVQIRKTIDRYGKKPNEKFLDRSKAVAELSEAMQSLADIHREGPPRLAAIARVWAGRAYLCQGMPDRALAQMTTVRQQRPFGAEAIIGSLEEMELLADQGRGLEMVQTTRFIMHELVNEQGFDASLLSFDEFQRRMIVALERLRDHGKYPAAIDIARMLPPVFSPAEALMQEGITYREWGASTVKEGTGIGGDVSRAASSLARTRFRAAGDAFAQAAEYDYDTPRYLPTTWAAIDAYQQGRHYGRSIQLLRPYLRYEERRRQPRGLVAFGRALLADNKPIEAIDSLETCIAEFTRDPLRYDARLLLAMACSEIGDLDKARAYLMDNLHDGELTPQSPAWRDSLFTLAEMLYRKGYENHLLAEQAYPAERIELLKKNQPILEDAIRRLDESAERYWPSPRAQMAAYLAARSHVLAAEWPRLESIAPDVLDTARRSLRNKVDTELQAALDGFGRLRESLLIREDEQRLSDDAKSMLRNCFMAEADTLKELGRLDDAAVAYRAVSLRYMNEPPALEAILGQARCMKALSRKREADLLIRQAEVVLQRIPTRFDGEFDRTTRYDRKGWEQLLAWMNSGIDDLGGIPGRS